MRGGWIAWLLVGCGFDSSGVGDASASGETSTAPTATETTTSDPVTSASTASSTVTGGSSSTAAGTEGSTEAGETADVEVMLEGLRVEMPCMRDCNDNDRLCEMDPMVEMAAVLTGAPGATYDVTLRVRGVVENGPYENGIDLSDVYVDGQPSSGRNTFWVEVSEPAHTYWLNVGTNLPEAELADYTFTLPVGGGATLTLNGFASADSCGLRNLDGNEEPIVVPGIEPAPEPFNGQFLQLDIETIVQAN